MQEYTLSLVGTYALYLSLTFLVPILIGHAKGKYTKMMWILAWLALTIPAGFRSNTGQDWGLYENAYQSIVLRGGNFFESPFNIEMTFKLFTFISYHLSGSSLLLFILYSSLTNLFTLLGIYRFKDNINPAKAVFVYISLLYFFQYNLGRQFLATMIIFWGLKDILDRKFIRFVITVIAASFFHNTALLILPLYFYGIAAEKQRKFRKLYSFILNISPLILFLFMNQLLSLAYTMLGNQKYYNYTMLSDPTFGLGIFIQIASGILIYLSYRKQGCNLTKNAGLLHMLLRIYILYSAFFFFQYFMTNFAGRIYLYFVPAEILLLGAVLSSIEIKSKFGKITTGMIELSFVSLILLQTFHAILSNAQNHVPYSFRYI